MRRTRGEAGRRRLRVAVVLRVEVLLFDVEELLEAGFFVVDLVDEVDVCDVLDVPSSSSSSLLFV